MKKVFKSKKTFLGLVIFILLVLIIFFINFFNKNNNEKLKGSVSEFINYSDDFTDSGFYACVVNAYNKENNTEVLLNEKLTDNQLASIKTVECNTSGDKYKFDDSNSNSNSNKLSYGHPNYNEDLIQLYKDNLTLQYTDEYYSDYVFANFDVKNIDGIEKLTGLEKLVVEVLEDDEIDLSKNTNLKYLDLYLPANVSSLDLTNNTNLTNLLMNVNNKEFNYKGFDKLINLTELYINNLAAARLEYNFEAVSNYTNLEKLSLINVGLNDLSYIKDLEKIKELALKNNGISKESETTLSNISSLTNLEYLYLNESCNIGELPELPNLISLNVNSKIIEALDLTKLVNLKKIVLPNIKKFDSSSADYEPIKVMSDYSELKELKNLEYLIVGDGYHINYYYSDYSWQTINALDWFPKLHTLVVNNSYGNTALIGTNSLKTLYILSGGVSKTYNLKLEYIYGQIPENLPLDNMVQIYNNSNSSYCNYDNVVSFPNLEEFYEECGIKTSKLLTAPNLQKAYIHYLNMDTQTFDLKNFTKLNTFIALYSSDVNVSGVFNNSILEHFVGWVNEEEKIEEDSNLKYLNISSSVADIDFTKLPNLKYLEISRKGYIGKLDLSNNKELLYLSLNDSFLDKILINNSNKLNVLYMNGYNYHYDFYPQQYGFVGTKSKIIGQIELPKQFYFEQISESEYAELENNNLKGKKAGSDSIRIMLNNYNPSSINYKSSNWVRFDYFNGYERDIDFTISDIYSSKLEINNEEGYIYTKGFTKEKDIINSIYFRPNDLTGTRYGAVDKNNFKTFVFTSAIKDLKLIKITSNKYKIDGNNITYYGEFNIDNVRVTNADKEVNGDELIIKYNNKVVDKYKLVKLNSLIGDTNNDGEITISDMVLQYKHVNYELDLKDDGFYRADIDSNDDVEEKDVDMLYNNIKLND